MLNITCDDPELKAHLEAEAAKWPVSVHGYKVDTGCYVLCPKGNGYFPTRIKDVTSADPVIAYLRANTSPSATQADVVTKIKEYFEGPREVGPFTLSYWYEGEDRFIEVQPGSFLIGHGWNAANAYHNNPPVIRAAKEAFRDTAPELPEVAAFIEAWKEPEWHDSTLRCQRDGANRVIIPTPGGRFIRLSLDTGVATIHNTQEEAKMKIQVDRFTVWEDSYGIEVHHPDFGHCGDLSLRIGGGTVDDGTPAIVIFDEVERWAEGREVTVESVAAKLREVLGC